MTTYRDVLNRLPSPYHRQAIDEWERHGTVGLDAQTTYGAVHAIAVGFWWNGSRGGQDYWGAMHDYATAHNL